jgi:hypothetical protein
MEKPEDRIDMSRSEFSERIWTNRIASFCFGGFMIFMFLLIIGMYLP